MKFKSQFYASIKNQETKVLYFIKTLKLTIEIYSSLSNINIHYYLQHGIPKRHRQFFRKLSLNPELVKTYCNDLNNLFDFACRRWMINQ